MFALLSSSPRAAVAAAGSVRAACPSSRTRGIVIAILMLCLAQVVIAQPTVDRVTSKIPFPRGLALVDLDRDGADELYVLSRGRVRGSGGADGRIDDRAGTIWRVDPATGETTVFAEPTSPPFKLLDRTLNRPRDDRQTDRPYCTLRWHEPTRSFYLCAFSGVDLPADGDAKAAETGYFSKNYTDAVLGYDVDDRRWFEVDRHDPQFDADFPGADSRGWVKGPDNLVAIDDTLIVAAKDNNCLVAYDLAGNQPPRVVLGETVRLANRGGVARTVRGHSALGIRDDWLYVAFRTSGEVIRVPILHEHGEDGRSLVHLDVDAAELLAEFQPWNPATGASANITDLSIGPDGDVYVVSAMPARIYRFTPNPANIRDFTNGRGAWFDLAAHTGNPRSKSENVLVAGDGTVYVTSGDAYANDQGPGLGGTIWRVRE